MPNAIVSLPLLALAAALAAQERRPTFGRVDDDGGAPAAQVQVHCVGAPWFGEVDGPTDHVETLTDARGRFVVQLLPDRSYTTWAATAAAGTLAVSMPVELVAGDDVTLQLPARQPRPRIELRGADAWADFGPLQLEAAPYCHEVPRVPVNDALLPPLPGPLWLVRSRDGELLWRQGGNIVDPRIRLSWVDPRADASVIAIELPPPQSLGIRVTSAGKLVDGAVVWYAPGHFPFGLALPTGWIRQPRRDELRRVGTTRGDGTAQLRVPAHLGKGQVLTPVHLQVRAAGHAWTNAGVSGGPLPPYSGGMGLKVPADQVLPVALPPESPLMVDPPGPCALLVLGSLMANVQSTEQILRVQADARGRAVLPLPREMRGGLVRALPEGETTPVWTALEPAAEGFRVALRSRLVTVQVRDVRGGPPQGARAVVVPMPECNARSDIPLPLDGAGRGRIRLGPGGWLVLVSASRTVAWRSLRAGEADQDWTLDLQPMPCAVLRLVDAKDKPLAWCALPGSMSGNLPRGNPDAEAAILGLRMQALWPKASDGEGLLHFPILVSAWSWTLNTPAGLIQLEVGKTVDVTLR